MVRAALALALLGCASAAPSTGTATPAAPAVTLSYKEELRRALEVTADQPTVVLRHAPCKCACPPFEARLGLRWIRVVIDGFDDPASVAARLVRAAQDDDAAGQPREYVASGDLSTSLDTCGPGTPVVSFGLEAFE